MANFAAEDARRAIGELVTILEQNFDGFNISEIVKGGSMGHGTAIPGHFDIDLVLYSRDIDGHAVLRQRNGFEPWVKKLHAFLSSRLSSRDYNCTCITQHSVQFVYKGQVDVDLLVSPYWANQHELYRFLQSVPQQRRQMFSVCAAKWQVDFFKQQPNEVKKYIRRAKAWRNQMWPKGRPGEGKPTSYLLSLLVLKAYETKGHRTITQSLQDLVTGSPDICWEVYYERCDYPNLLPSRPRIVDPANPANNVWITGLKKCNPGEKISDYEPGDGNSVLLRRYIHTIDLSKPI